MSVSYSVSAHLLIDLLEICRKWKTFNMQDCFGNFWPFVSDRKWHRSEKYIFTLVFKPTVAVGQLIDFESLMLESLSADELRGLLLKHVATVTGVRGWERRVYKREKVSRVLWALRPPALAQTYFTGVNNWVNTITRVECGWHKCNTTVPKLQGKSCFGAFSNTITARLYTNPLFIGMFIEKNSKHLYRVIHEMRVQATSIL